MASTEGELQACQPYGGANTHVPDYGQGPNVVLGQAEQYGLLPGSKVYCDNLYTNSDLPNHMGDRHLVLTGTLCQNRMIGVPLLSLSKKEAKKTMKRGDSQAVYTQDSICILWKDNKPGQQL